MPVRKKFLKEYSESFSRHRGIRTCVHNKMNTGSQYHSANVISTELVSTSV